MNIFIKFEDTYGVYTLFNKLVMNSKLYPIAMEEGDYRHSIHIEGGYGNSKIFKYNTEFLDILKEYSIQKIIYVYDVDHSSDVADIMRISDFTKWNKDSNRIYDSMDIQVRYIPVVYEAESLMLYQYIEGDVPVTDMVNIYSTRLMHQELLRLVTGCKSIREVKMFNFKIYPNILRYALFKYSKIDKFNQEVIKLLLSCSEEEIDKVGLTYEQAVQHLQELRVYFSNLKNNDEYIKLNLRGQFYNLKTEIVNLDYVRNSR